MYIIIECMYDKTEYYAIPKLFLKCIEKHLSGN